MNKSIDKIVLLDDWMLIKQFPPAKQKGKIILSDQAKVQEAIGEVLATGPGAPDPHATSSTTQVTMPDGQKRTMLDQRRRAMFVRKGDIVAYSKYAGEKIVILDEEPYIVLTESQVIAVLGEDFRPAPDSEA